MASFPLPTRRPSQRKKSLDTDSSLSTPVHSNIENNADISNQSVNQFVRGDLNINQISPGNELRKERITCINQLFRISPGEVKEDLKVRKGVRATGTCDWFLKSPELAAWRTSDVPSDHVFWLFGHPGTGKSIMSIFLADTLEEEFASCADRTLIYFFCEANVDAQNTAISILRGLIYHLLQQHEYLADKYLVREFEVQGPKLFASVSSLWRIFSSMIQDREVGQVYCIIDALDECNGDSRDLFLQYLEHNYGQTDSRNGRPKARILITSRQHQDIMDHLSTFPHKDIRSFEDVRADVDILISKKISELKEKRGYTLNLQKQVTTILKEKAEGTFLWIGLACKQLMKTRAKDAIRVLNRFPAGLDKIYKSLLQMALDEDEPDAEIVKQILSFVALFRRPVTLTQLALACGLFETEDKSDRDLFMENYVDMCRSMVVIDDGLVRLLHRSVEEFLFESAAEHFPSRSQIHADIADRCLDHLISNLSSFRPQQICDNTFLEYASVFWPRHAHLADDHYRIKNRHFAFFNFTSEKREMWLNVLSALGENVPLNFSIFHVAARWGVSSLMDHAKSSDFFVGWNIQTDGQSMLDAYAALFEGYSCNPLEEAAAFENSAPLRSLLQLRTVEIDGKLQIVDLTSIKSDRCYQFPVTSDVLMNAIRKSDAGRDILELISEVRPREFLLNDGLLAEVAKSQKNGMDMFKFLLATYPETAIMNESILRAALTNEKDGMNIITAVLATRSVKIGDWQLLQHIILAECEADVIISCLSLPDLSLHITSKVVNALGENEHDIQPVMTYLIDLPGQQFEPCVDLARGVIRNFDVTTVEKILPLCSIDEDQDLVAYAAANTRCGDDLVTILLKEAENFTLSTKTLVAAVSNVKLADKILEAFRSFSHESLYLDSDVLEAAIENLELRENIFDIIVDSDSFELNITEKTFLAAAASDDPPLHIVSSLVTQTRHHFSMTTGLAQALVACEMQTKLSEMLQQENVSIPLTPEFLRIAAGHLGQDILKRLLHRFPSHIRDRTELLVDAAAAGNLDVVRMLLSNETSQTYQVHHDTHAHALTAAAQNDHIRTVELLLDHGVPVDARSDIYGTALQAASIKGNLSMVQFLLDKKAVVDTNSGEYGTALQAASRKGNIQVVKVLLSSKADVNLEGGLFGNALLAAVQNGSVEVVQLLLDAGANVNARGRQHLTALQAAVAMNGAQLLRLLIDRGADLNASLHSYVLIVCTVAAGDTQLLHRLLSGKKIDALPYPGLMSRVPSCQGDPIQVAHYLLRHGADVDSTNQHGITCLHRAASIDLDLCRVLYRAGASIHVRDKTGTSVLYYAAYNGQLKIVKWLLSLGASIHDPDENGWTSLHAAATESFGIFELLCNAGADFNAVTSTGSSCLSIASEWGELEIVEWLLSEKVDVNQADKNGFTPLHYGCNRSIVQALHAAGADIEARTRTGQSIFDQACEIGDVDLIEWLLSLGFDVNHRDSTGYSPLHAAAKCDNVAACKLLVSAGANPNMTDNDKSSTLHYAAKTGSSETLKYFVELGVDVNQQSQSGWTALHHAAHEGHDEAAKILLDNGASTEVLLDNGLTALSLACQTGRKGVAMLLIAEHPEVTRIDSYGRTTGDWLKVSILDPTLYSAVVNQPEPLAETVEAIASQGVVSCSSDILLNGCKPKIDDLGRRLLFLADLDNANFAFQHRISSDDVERTDSTKHGDVGCDCCSACPIRGTRYMCKTCWNMNLCHVCMEEYLELQEVRQCRNHEYFEVKVLPKEEVAEDEVELWLKSIIKKYSKIAGDGGKSERSCGEETDVSSTQPEELSESPSTVTVIKKS